MRLCKDKPANGFFVQNRYAARPSRPSASRNGENALKPSPSRGGLGGDGVERASQQWNAVMQGQTNQRILHARLQRRLRNASTDAESKLWQRLRHRQLDGCKFRRQHPYGSYILDFVCLERKVVVELDGSQHADQIHYDEKRTLFLKETGFIVLRFWNNEVFENMEGLLEVILGSLRTAATPSPPNPPLEGEG
jgi:very-short-patch-repair endonuclease